MACHPTSQLLAPLAALLLLLLFFTLINNSPCHLHLLPHPNSTPRHPEGLSVLLTGPTSLALKDPAHGPPRLDIFDHHHDSSHQPHYNVMVETDLADDRLFCKLFEMVPFTHILLRHCQVDRTAPLNIQERASFVKSIPSKQVTSAGVEGFHGDPNIPEKEAINELGKGDDEGMNVGKEKNKQFPDMHRLGRRGRLLQNKGSSPTPRLVAVSRASGPVTPSGPSPCTHIPKGKGHC